MAPNLPINQCYTLLGVPQGAAREEIRKSYRNLVLEFHPDKTAPNRLAENTERFREIQEAYEVLCREEEVRSRTAAPKAPNATKPPNAPNQAQDESNNRKNDKPNETANTAFPVNLEELNRWENAKVEWAQAQMIWQGAKNEYDRAEGRLLNLMEPFIIPDPPMQRWQNPGISPELRQKAWEDFERAKKEAWDEPERVKHRFRLMDRGLHSAQREWILAITRWKDELAKCVTWVNWIQKIAWWREWTEVRELERYYSYYG